MRVLSCCFSALLFYFSMSSYAQSELSQDRPEVNLQELNFSVKSEFDSSYYTKFNESFYTEARKLPYSGNAEFVDAFRSRMGISVTPLMSNGVMRMVGSIELERASRFEEFVRNARELNLIMKCQVTVDSDKVNFEIDLNKLDATNSKLLISQIPLSQENSIPERITQEYEKMIEKRTAAAATNNQPSGSIYEAPQIVEVFEKQIPTYNPG